MISSTMGASLKPGALSLALMLLIAGFSPVYGQGLRAAPSRGSSVRGGLTSPSAPAAPTFPRSQSSQRLQVPPVNLQQPPTVTLQPNQPWTHMTPGTKPSLSPRATTIVTLPAGPQPPRLIDGSHHQRRPRPPHFHPGIIFLDGPRLYSTTIITEVAPGVARADRRYVNQPSSTVPVRGEDRLAPFDPTPNEVIERLLALAGVKKSDVVYDLGSGDGRILIAAAKKYGVRGVGYEIDPGLVKLARENIRRAGLEKLVEIRQEDFLSADLSPASVVTLYLSYDGNLAVRDQLNEQLKPGARVVSYTFDMGDWQPKITELYRDAAGNVHQLYLWEIGKQTLAYKPSDPIIAPYPARNGPLIIEVN